MPKRERWVPNRLAHWLPSVAVSVLVVVSIVAGGGRADQAVASESAAAAQAPGSVANSATAAVPALTSTPDASTADAPPAVSAADQRAALNALRAHWNDWGAHYNIAVAQVQEGNWNYAVAHATSAFLLHPSSAANRANLRFAIQQAGTMDPTLRRLLYGAWFQRYPALLSPAGWQRVGLAASLVLAAGLIAIVLGLYVTGMDSHVAAATDLQSLGRAHRRTLRLAGRSAMAAGVVSLIVAVAAFNAYGSLNRPDAGILLETVNLSPSPTELVPERETSPATAGSVVLPVSGFLGWQQIVGGANFAGGASVTGWVRGRAVMPLYETSRH